VWRGIFIIQYYNWCGVVFSLFNIKTGVAWYFYFFILKMGGGIIEFNLISTL
jgi:hypothetical protein